jgi:hypothetical protein
MAAPAVKIVPNTAASPKAILFDRTNAAHCKYVNQFLVSKNQLGLYDTLVARLEGKNFTQTNVAEEFKVIDPEAFTEPKEV